jgi:hypothetical protein
MWTIFKWLRIVSLVHISRELVTNSRETEGILREEALLQLLHDEDWS